LLIVLLTQAQGTSMVTENVYDGRFGIVDQLRSMGADIDLEGHHAVVRGPRQLIGGPVVSTDLRAGAALVLAGLVAEGITVVMEPRHIDRGYADFAGRLRSLGADVERVAARAVAV
jgi:UDP-N-acetylglucosamine 1-carboxyvinyltransferase